MTEMKKVGDLEIAQDLKFQRAEWRFQRAGWFVMVAIIVGALAGAFGRGPLARTRTTASDGSFELRYDRMARHAANASFQFTIRQPGADTIGIWFDTEFLQGLDLQQVTPTPIRAASGQGRTTFYFAVAADASIEFSYQPDDIGRRRAALGLEKGGSTAIRQFIFP